MITTKIIKGDTDPAIQDAYFIRDLVFTQEQGFPTEFEIDDYDNIAWHCIVYRDDMAIGTGRLIPQENNGKIGRVAVLKEFRGLGIGFQVMNAIIEQAQSVGCENLNLSAQVYAIPFYEKLGFVTEGDQYLEEGEPHIHMAKPLENSTATLLY